MKMANVEALKKIAYDEDGNEYQSWLQMPAGIGTWNFNALKSFPRAGDGWVGYQGLGLKSQAKNKGSYFSALMNNAKADPASGMGTKATIKGRSAPSRGTAALDALERVAPAELQGDPNNREITNDELSGIRYSQARDAARRFAVPDTDEFKSLVEDLVNAGAKNHESFKNTKRVPWRRLSLPSAGKLKLDEKARQSLEAAQNSMASAGGGSRYAKTAQAAPAPEPAPSPAPATAANTGLWDSVLEKIKAAREWYDNPANSAWRPIVAGGLGFLGGGLISKLLGGKFGTGAMVGGLGGLGYGAVDWNALKDSLGKKKDEKKQDGAEAPGGSSQDK